MLTGVAVAGASWWALLFGSAWVCAYPIGYYGGRALSARVRRGSWTRLARREAVRALPWAVLTALFGLPLLVAMPWLAAVVPVLAVLWAAGLVVAARRGERSLSNDALLLAQALVAVPLTVAVVSGPDSLTHGLGAETLQATLVIGTYLAGSVLHVKSLLREAGRPSFRRADRAWHAAALVATVAADPWWALGFGPALVRSVVGRPGTAPAVLGAIEAVVAVLVVLAAYVAL